MILSHRWIAGLVIVLAAGFLNLRGTPVFANELRAYWATSGTFGPGDIRNSHPTAPSQTIVSPISMWIIDHPKGLVVFDTGNNVAISDGNCATYWAEALCKGLTPSQTRNDVIDRQLERLGFSVDQVKFVITSHSHLDHIGNIEMFPKAVHVIQAQEMVQARHPEKFKHAGAHIPTDYDGISGFNFMEINGDLDLFGDGSLMILSTPGHTTGHQSILLQLKETGPVIITGDAIPRKVVLEGHIHRINQDPEMYMRSVNRLKELRDRDGAKLLLSHEPSLFEGGGNRWYR